MRNLALLILLFAIISCNQPKKPDSRKSEQKPNNTPTLVLKDSTPKKKNENEADKKVDENSCNCPKPFNTAGTQEKINYKGRFLKFCSWDFDSTTKTTYEFHIFSDKDSLLLHGDIPTEFKVKSFKAPLKLIQSSEMPSDTSESWEYTPIFEYEIKLIDSCFEIQREFIFQAPIISKSKQDSILSIFKKQPKHNGNWDRENPPFTNEKYVMDLFLSAVNGNKDCINAYDSLNTRFVTDGAIGELYYELLGLLGSYKNRKTTSANSGS